MADEFDPYHKWLAIPADEQPPNHYRLLGVRIFESDADVISNAADQRMAHVRTLQVGKHSALSQKILSQIATAKLCLLNPDKRAAYDQSLQADNATKPAKPAVKTAQGLKQAKSLPVAKAPVAEVAAANAAATRSATPARIESHADRKKSVSESGRSSDSTKRMALVGGAALILILAAFGVVKWRSSNLEPVEAPAIADRTTQPASQPGIEETSAEASDPTAADPTAAEVEPTAEAPSADDSRIAEPAAAQPEEEPPAVPEVPADDSTEDNDEGPTAVAVKDEPAAHAAVSPPPKPEDTRLPVPSKPDAARALALVKDVYSDDYRRAKKPADRLALADKLLKAGVEESDPLQRYVLLSEARAGGIAGGGAETVFRATDLLITQFDVERSGAILTAVEKLSEKEMPGAARVQLVRQIDGLLDAAIEEEQFERAAKLAAAAAVTARKGKLVDQTKVLAKRAAQVGELAKQFRAAEEARTVLAAEPKDPQASLALARYLCYSREDWKAGLPLLAQAGDSELSAAAAEELNLPVTTEEQVKMADLWWSLSERDKTSARQPLARHAAQLYAAALPGLSGLSKDRVARRLEEIDEGYPASISTWGKFRLKKAEKLGDYVRIHSGGWITTAESHAGALDVSFVARTDKDNIRVRAHGAREGVIWNWEVRPHELRVHWLPDQTDFTQVEPLKLNTWYRLRWVISPREIRVFTDGKLVYHKGGKFDLSRSKPVYIWTGNGSTVDVRSLVVRAADWKAQ